MKKVIAILSQPKIIFAALGFFLLACLLSNTLFRQSYTYLSQTFDYNPDTVYSLLNVIGENGRNAHLLIFIADLAMILSYTVFLIGANYSTFKSWIKSCGLISFITFFPLLLALIQLSEIAVLTIIIVQYNHVLESMVYLSRFLTQTKYYLTAICFLLPIVGLCGTIVIRLLKSGYRRSEE